MEEFSGNSLTFIGHEDLKYIPPWLSSKYASTTRRLDLSYNALRSLKGLAGFEEVTELMLDNNQLDENASLQPNSNLQTLTLNKNKIKTLDVLIPRLSENFPNLTYLSLLGNDACPDQLTGSTGDDENDYQRYRYYVLFHLPNLKFLDFTQVTAHELKEAQRVGAFMNRVSADTAADVVGSGERRKGEKREIKRQDGGDSKYNPLPDVSSKEGEHKSSFGKCRYVYHGRQSEGNRFIKDNDL